MTDQQLLSGNIQCTSNVPIGTIIASLLSPGNIATVDNWLLCDGSDIPPEYQTFISLFGLSKLPKLCGRTLIGSGLADSGSTYNISTEGGEENHTLVLQEIPSHSHTINGGDFGLHFRSFEGNNDSDLPFETNSSTVLKGTDETGGGSPHNNMQPYYVVYYYIYMGKPIQ